MFEISLIRGNCGFCDRPLQFSPFQIVAGFRVPPAVEKFCKINICKRHSSSQMGSPD